MGYKIVSFFLLIATKVFIIYISSLCLIIPLKLMTTLYQKSNRTAMGNLKSSNIVMVEIIHLTCFFKIMSCIRFVKAEKF